MVEFFPVSIGLLVSMGIRRDHSFSFWMGQFESEETLEEKQIKIIQDVFDIYVNRHHTDDAQLLEEMSGKGFYQPAKEVAYRSAATPAAYDEAQRLCREYEDEN